MERVERPWGPMQATIAARHGWRSVTMSAREPGAAAAALEDLDDGDLVAECLAGTREAFDLIVERHRRTVYQLCYRFLNSHEDAADVAQEVFLRAYRGLGSFKGDASVGTWLYRIGVNASLNRLAARAPRAEPLDATGPLPDRSLDPAARLLRDEEAARVRRAIARLPAKQRATLVLRVYQELSHQEIASVVGSSVGAVKATFFHALRTLKRILERG